MAVVCPVGGLLLLRPSENFACTGSGCFRLLLCLGNRVRGEAVHLTGFQTAFLFRHSRAGGNLFGGLGGGGFLHLWLRLGQDSRLRGNDGSRVDSEFAEIPS